MNEQWLSIVEYARTLSVSDLTVRRRIKTGRLPAVLKEGKYYIPVKVDEAGNVIGRGNRGASANLESVSPPPSPVMKSHPVAQQTLAPTTEKPAAWAGMRVNASPSPTPALVSPPVSSPVIPRMIPTRETTEVVMAESALVAPNIQPMMELCESMIAKCSALEARIESESRARMLALESQVRALDSENKNLRQQVEDLQTLVRILEKRPG
jgi:hypothetical protein